MGGRDGQAYHTPQQATRAGKRKSGEHRVCDEGEDGAEHVATFVL